MSFSHALMPFLCQKAKRPNAFDRKMLADKAINLRLDITTKSACVVTSTLYKSSWISAAGHHAI